jgi:hypothetical protein
MPTIRLEKYVESFDAFFEYLRDDGLQNVVYEITARKAGSSFTRAPKLSGEILIMNW